MSGTQNNSLVKIDIFFFLAVFFLLILRVTSVVTTPLYLGPDEAQYWRWGQSFDWGYFSKPPMVAWVIGLTTGIFGDQEWAVRIGSPFFHTGSALLLYLVGRRLWSPQAAVLAGLCWALMGGVWLSSILMTTDVPLLFFWSAGLYALIRLRSGEGFLSAFGLGLAIGLGFLSKYAMIYFLIGLVIALIIDRETRKALLGLKGLVALAVFAALFTPHMMWNAENGFKTVSHTADNANWGTDLINPENAVEFITDQMGVFSPVHFIMLAVLLVSGLTLQSKFLKEDASARLLTGFIAPPLLIIIAEAFISRAHANWAASAYPAACLLVAAWAVRARGLVRLVMIAGLVFNLGFGLFASTLIMLPREDRPEWVVKGMPRSVRNWPETVEVVNASIAEHGVTSVIVDEREVWHDLDYYGRDGKISVPIRSWRREGHPKSASEEAPITAADSEKALVLSLRRNLRDPLLADFAEHEALGDIVIDLGGGKERRFEAFIVRDFQPQPRGEAITQD